MWSNIYYGERITYVSSGNCSYEPYASPDVKRTKRARQLRKANAQSKSNIRSK